VQERKFLNKKLKFLIKRKYRMRRKNKLLNKISQYNRNLFLKKLIKKAFQFKRLSQKMKLNLKLVKVQKNLNPLSKNQKSLHKSKIKP